MATLEGGDIYFYDLLVADGVAVYVVVAAYSSTDSESVPSNEKFLPACLANADCSDGDVCTGDELCVSGICTAGTALDCSISSPCQTGTCDSQLGCLTQPSADGTICDDGDVTTVGDVCQAGACIGQLPPPPECVADGDCADGDVCNGDELCSAGSCISGASLDCGISSQCEVGVCDSQLGCLTQPVLDGTICGDGDLNTVNDICQAGACVGEVPPPAPDCLGDEDCADGEVCNGTELCVSGICVSGTPAPDGTICLPELSTLVCQAGSCVEDPSLPPPPECGPDEGCEGFVLKNPCAPVFPAVLPAILYILEGDE